MRPSKEVLTKVMRKIEAAEDLTTVLLQNETGQPFLQQAWFEVFGIHLPPEAKPDMRESRESCVLHIIDPETMSNYPILIWLSAEQHQYIEFFTRNNHYRDKLYLLQTHIPKTWAKYSDDIEQLSALHKARRTVTKRLFTGLRTLNYHEMPRQWANLFKITGVLPEIPYPQGWNKDNSHQDTTLHEDNLAIYDACDEWTRRFRKATTQYINSNSRTYLPFLTSKDILPFSSLEKSEMYYRESAQYNVYSIGPHPNSTQRIRDDVAKFMRSYMDHNPLTKVLDKDDFVLPDVMVASLVATKIYTPKP